MTQFEKAIFNMQYLIEQGKVIAVGETSSYLATIYIIPYCTNDDHIYITYRNGQYEAMDSCDWAEMQVHYDEAEAEGVQIWEREDINE